MEARIEELENRTKEHLTVLLKDLTNAINNITSELKNRTTENNVVLSITGDANDLEERLRLHAETKEKAKLHNTIQ